LGLQPASASEPNSFDRPAIDRPGPVALLPTDRSLRNEFGLPLPQPIGPDQLPPERLPLIEVAPQTPGASAPVDWKRLMRPRFRLSAEWEAPTEGIGIRSYDASVSMPTYPFFGPPPPIVNAGYSYTNLDSPPALGLPHDLHEFSLSGSWVRRINDRWLARFTLGGAYASDLDNNTSQAWQLRAGAFAIFRPNPQWNFAFGALATGREDLPVLPGIGAIWEPSPEVKVNLMMPNPRVSVLLADRGQHQHWGYFGGGISGGTWAYRRSDGAGDRLSYNEWRLVLGWEVKPPQPPGTFVSSGPRMHAEIGYVLGRSFEFEDPLPDISLNGTLLLRTGFDF
jgi:hypothetical protein